MSFMTSDEYIEALARLCPSCRSDNTGGSHPEADVPHVHIEVMCLDCKATWMEHYRLSGYSGLELSEHD